MMKITDTVKHLIIINVILFVACLSFGEVAFDKLAIWYPENSNFGFWQIITHMFMHSNTFLPHIVFNMLGLWMFGSPLEQHWGRNKFLFFYFSAGLGAALLSLAFNYYDFNTGMNDLIALGYDKESVLSIINEGKYNTQWPSQLGEQKWDAFEGAAYSRGLGASGCVMGLLVGFGMLFPNVKLMMIFLPIPIKAKYFIPLLVGYEIISGFTGGASLFGVNVNHWAHVGGALTGLIIMLFWKKNQFNKYRADL